MQATVQATTKNIEILQETSTDDNAVIARKSGHLGTSGNVENVDDAQWVRGSNSFTPADGASILRFPSRLK